MKFGVLAVFMVGKERFESVRILLAECDDANRKVALLMLERLGYAADAVANGPDILNALKHRSYDLVLLNVRMPLMDGLEVTKKIRRFCLEAEQPKIIAITAYAHPDIEGMCKDAGMDDCIVKPVGLAELQRLLLEHIR